MPLFSPDNLLFGDRVGWGIWLDGHYREHQQFIDTGFVSSPPFLIPDYNFLAWSWADPQAKQDWLDVHADVHNIIRQATGVTGQDLATVDLDKAEYFAIWVDEHAQEHAQIRQALGLLG